jgi:MFS family permease
LSAHFISLAGNAMTLLAVPWFVLDTTGSPARTGVASAFMVIPVVISLAFGGVLVDRIGYRRLSIVGDLASGATVLLIPILHVTDLLTFPALLTLVFFSALLDAPGTTARIALLPDLAEAAGTPIERASSALDVIERSARMVGAPLAGGLIAWIGAANVLVVDAGTFAIAAVLVAASGAPAGASDSERTPYFAGLIDGLSVIRRDRLLRAIILMITVTNTLDLAYAGVILPVYADRVLGGAGALGLLVGVSGLGAAIGATTFGIAAHRLPRWQPFTAAFLVVGAPRYALFAAEPGLVTLVIATACVGFCAGMLNPILSTAGYERIPAPMRARALGTMRAGVLAASPIGPVLGGLLIGSLGLTSTLLVVAGAYLAATLSPLIFRATWRQLGG